MAVEYGPKGIRFVAVCPVVAGGTNLYVACLLLTLISPDFYCRTHLFIGKADTEENRKAFVATVPLGRTSTPQDVANACCYLASDEASFITGMLSQTRLV